MVAKYLKVIVLVALSTLGAAALTWALTTLKVVVMMLGTFVVAFLVVLTIVWTAMLFVEWLTSEV